ncbi:MAG TPA: toxin-antitoxin system HicB family antitoxin [Actinokineospora sp.]|jgi:plasmid stability protein|nr:toxin-antitoxin system HicB family antitoxin [Actinokineospora sp.]
MITRLDDDLHARLKERAAAANRSVNELVIEYLTTALDAKITRKALRDRVRAAGKLVTPPTTTSRVHRSREEVIALGRGAGTSVSDALAAERAAG